MNADQRRRHAIEAFQDVIVEIYREHGLRSISGLDNSYVLNERQVLQWYYKVIRKAQIKFKDVNFHEVFDDLVFCSDEIMHFTAQLFLYLPYLNSPIRDAYELEGQIIYPNQQNLAAKRFGMFTNSVFEKLYNYWDRIGDLIAIYFPEKFAGKKVYFGTVIGAIQDEFKASDNYRWLKEFKENEYNGLNEKRIKVVHYINNDTTFKYKHLALLGDREALERLIAERDELPEYFKKQIDFILTGFEKTVQLLEEITEKRLQDIE